jgi:uncharacterized protein (UPF0333 family)
LLSFAYAAACVAGAAVAVRTAAALAAAGNVSQEYDRVKNSCYFFIRHKTKVTFFCKRVNKQGITITQVNATSEMAASPSPVKIMIIIIVLKYDG